MIRGERFREVDVRLTTWMAKNGIFILRISIGVIFTWFGMLKFFPTLSPAESLATKTIEILSFGLIESRTGVVILAIWESIIGLGFILGRYLREIILLLFVQMMGTIAPVFLFPEDVFRTVPFILTLEGQYIVKNLVVLSGGIVVGATVRGGRLIADPDDENVKY